MPLMAAQTESVELLHTFEACDVRQRIGAGRVARNPPARFQKPVIP